MFRRLIFCLLLLVAGAGAFALTVTAGFGASVAPRRVALVIGVSNYQHAGALANTINDAGDMAKVLERVGFDVELVLDPNRSDLEAAVRRFADRSVGADVSVLHYSGHALEANGRNWLLPVSAMINNERDLHFEAVDLNTVIEATDGAAKVSIIFLDACRDNPFIERLAATGRGMSHGLAALQIAANGVLVAFSTAPGQIAFDGGPDARNSPFTAALLRHIENPGLEVRALIGRVTKDVVDQTRGRQRPWQNSSLEGEFYFVPPQTGVAELPAAANNAEIVFWETIKGSNDPADYRAYLAHFPAGLFSDLAREALKRLPAPAAKLEPTAPTDDATPIGDPVLLKEMRARLYELNYDPGPREGAETEAARAALRAFEQQNGLPMTGRATFGLLRHLRASASLKPWGAIVYDKARQKWGMAWNEETREAAVSHAQVSCAGNKDCAVEVSFFRAECAAFAHSAAGWSIVARDTAEQARQAALAECAKGGRAC